MITNNLVVKIQNLVVNHESRPIILNPAPRCRGQHLADVNIFYTSVVISVNFKNHASVIIISQCIGEWSFVLYNENRSNTVRGGGGGGKLCLQAILLLVC